MLKKTIEYVDYNGVNRREDRYFNFSKAELMEMELSTTGGYTTMVQRLIDTENQPELMKLFKELILKSYGEKSDDGKRFIKSEELSTAFSQTEAYSNLFMELITDTEAAIAFVNGVVPAELAKEAAKNASAPVLAPVV